MYREGKNVEHVQAVVSFIFKAALIDLKVKDKLIVNFLLTPFSRPA